MALTVSCPLHEHDQATQQATQALEHLEMPLQNTITSRYGLSDSDSGPSYSDNSDYHEDSPDTFTGPRWEKDDNVTFEPHAGGEWPPTIVTYSPDIQTISDSMVDRYHPHLEAGHVLWMNIGPYPFLVMIVTLLPGILHGVLPGQITHWTLGGGITPGRHRTVFIGPKQYVIRILRRLDSQPVEGVEFEEDVASETGSSEHSGGDVYTPESDAGSLTEEEDGDWYDDDESEDSGSEREEYGELEEGEWEEGEREEEGEWEEGAQWDEDGEWEEWTPESVESISTLPLYSSPTRPSPSPPPYSSPSQTFSSPLDFAEERDQIPDWHTPRASQEASQSLRQRNRPQSGRDDASDSEDGMDSNDISLSPPYSPILGESALWAGTEGAPPIVLPHRELPLPPTGTLRVRTSMTSANNVSMESLPSSMTSDDPPRLSVRLSPLDIEIRRPLPSIASSSSSSSTSTLRCMTSPIAECYETSSVASSPTPRMLIGSSPVGLPSLRTPPMIEGRAQQIQSSPINVQISPPIRSNRLPTILESPPLTDTPRQNKYTAEFTESPFLVQSPFPIMDDRTLGYKPSPRKADDPRSPRNSMVLDSPHTDIQAMWNPSPHEIAELCGLRDLSIGAPQHRRPNVQRETDSPWSNGSSSPASDVSIYENDEVFLWSSPTCDCISAAPVGLEDACYDLRTSEDHARFLERPWITGERAIWQSPPF